MNNDDKDSFSKRHPVLCTLAYIGFCPLCALLAHICGCNIGGRTYYDPETGDYYTWGPD